MARRSSGGRSRSASKPSRPSNVPTPVKASPPAMTGSSTGVLGGLVSVIVDGMAWGGANAIAHRVVDAIMGPRVVRVETVTSPAPAPAPASHAAPNVATSDACVTQSKAFEDCLNASGTDIGHCQFYMDMLTECRNVASSSTAASVVF